MESRGFLCVVLLGHDVGERPYPPVNVGGGKLDQRVLRRLCVSVERPHTDEGEYDSTTGCSLMLPSGSPYHRPFERP